MLLADDRNIARVWSHAVSNNCDSGAVKLFAKIVKERSVCVMQP